ncbi:hypothetical protein HO594_02165 [Streptococcus suis]|nr:hypothetical protein [Streptococcus suis]
MRKVYKKIGVIGAVLGVSLSNLSTVVPIFDGNLGSTIVHANTNREQRVVLLTRILSVKEVKDLAAVQRDVKKYGNLIGDLLRTAPHKGVNLVGIALKMSSDAVFNRTVAEAARRGKRLRLVVTDNKYYHTSYSLRNEYSIIN